MGGKTWSELEEAVFWEIALLAPSGDTSKTAWEETLVPMMRRQMQTLLGPGEELRREYNGNSCHEHYFWNYQARNRHYSPRARPYVAKYEQKLAEREAQNLQGSNQQDAAESSAVAETHTDQMSLVTQQLLNQQGSASTTHFVNSNGEDQSYGQQNLNSGLMSNPNAAAAGNTHLDWLMSQQYGQQNTSMTASMSTVPVGQSYTAAPGPVPAIQDIYNPNMQNAVSTGMTTGSAPPQPDVHQQHQANNLQNSIHAQYRENSLQSSGHASNHAASPEIAHPEQSIHQVQRMTDEWQYGSQAYHDASLMVYGIPAQQSMPTGGSGPFLSQDEILHDVNSNAQNSWNTNSHTSHPTSLLNFGPTPEAVTDSVQPPSNWMNTSDDDELFDPLMYGEEDGMEREEE